MNEIIIIFILFFISIITVIPIPILNGRVIDLIVNTHRFNDVLITILLIVILELSRYLVMCYTKKKITQINNDVIVKVKSNILNTIFDFKMSYLNRKEIGYIGSRLKEVENISLIFSANTLNSFFTIIDLVISLIISATINYRIVILMIPIFLLMAFITKKNSEKIKKLSILNYEKMALENKKLFSILSLIEGIKMFNMKEKESKNYEQSASLASFYSNKLQYYTIVFGENILLLTKLSMIIILLISSYLIFTGTLTLGGYTTISQYIGRITSNITILVMLPITLKPSLISLKRIIEFISIDKDRNGEEFNEKINEIRLRNICFSYGDNEEQILRKISMKLETGNIYHLIGDNGKGKTTLAKIICNLYDADSGSYLINNKDISVYSSASIRNHIVITGHKFYLHEENLFDNLFKNYNEFEKIIDEFDLENELNFTLKNENVKIQKDGRELSSGQKQMLEIIRAVLLDKDILIFDEPLANLDIQSKVKILNLIKNIKDKIVIVISHESLGEGVTTLTPFIM